MANHPNRKRSTKTKTVSPASPVHDHELDYNSLLMTMRDAFANARGPLFETNADDLNGIYLSRLPDERQIHDCSACRHFLQRFGGLVTIAADGLTVPALWDPMVTPAFYLRSVGAMANAVANARVIGPFHSGDGTWGTPQTGDWTHMSVKSSRIYSHPLLTAGQAMAKKREDFATVARALSEFSAPMIAQALSAIDSGWLASEQKFQAPLRWLADLHAKRTAAKDRRVRDNLLWLAIATAPDGYCHPRASVIGTLLEDIAAGLDFQTVRARFNAKVHPLQYQRPQAHPSAGNIAEGEKIIATMGLERSLVRRFARLDECVTIWKPMLPPPPIKVDGVFSHLVPKDRSDMKVRPLIIPPQTMTWQKFVSTVLPTGECIEVNLMGRMPFSAFVTAEHADAPNILKWDNPVSWYTYHQPTPPSRWGLAPGWAKVTGIVPASPTWGDNPKPYLGDGVVMVIDGCVDTMTGQGNALFPECLIAELHAVRSTIEAYSRSAELQGRDQASACGLSVRNGQIGYDVRVTVAGAINRYRIDRWD